MVCGDPAQVVSRILLTVDVTAAVIDEAIDGAFDLVLAHHPFLMRGVTTLAEDSLKGATLSKAIRAGIAIYAAHTNADIVVDGVSDTLAKRLGLSETQALVPSGSDANVGHGRIGNLESPMSLEEFAASLSQALPRTAGGVRIAGNRNRRIARVALCGGAGDSFIDVAFSSGADVYVTSDLRHHPTQDAIERARAAEREFSLIDISHWAAESLWLEVASGQLAGIFEGVQIVVSGVRTDPWDFHLA